MLTYKRLPKAERVKVTALSPSGKIRPQTLDAAYAPVEEVLISLKTSEAGVSDQEARNRLAERGFNEVTYSETVSLAWQFIRNFGNPFVALLSVLSLIAFLLGDNRGAVLILVMVVVSVLLRFVQEFRSNRTVAKLRNLVGAAITVLRTNDGGENCRREVPIREIVAGDIVLLSAGDMVPADVRLLSARDLFVSQSVLSGEALPVEKFETLQNQPVRRTRIPGREELTDLAKPLFYGNERGQWNRYGGRNCHR